MIKISQEIQVTNLLNELIAATKVIPKFRVSGSLRYRLSHTRDGVLRGKKNFSPKLGGRS